MLDWHSQRYILCKKKFFENSTILHAIQISKEAKYESQTQQIQQEKPQVSYASEKVTKETTYHQARSRDTEVNLKWCNSAIMDNFLQLEEEIRQLKRNKSKENKQTERTNNNK